MSKQYDLAVFIGRMAPCHAGHIENINKALELADNVLLLFGSANAPRDERNPFSYFERVRMTFASLSLRVLDKIHKAPINDFPSHDIWAGEVQRAAQQVLNKIDGKSVVLVGLKKDESSFYLDLFPSWDFAETECYKHGDGAMTATKIRDLLFQGKIEEIKPLVSIGAHQYLKQFIEGVTYENIRAEYEYHVRYPAHRRASYPINDVTADSVVLCAGHVLLIRRKNIPGKGKLALPGGFVQTDETVQEGAIRELIEETRLKVPEKVIRGSIVDEQRFDKPTRSLRGRIMTFAFTVSLQPNADGKLPRVYGADDAEKAFWVPIAEIMDPEKAADFFEDHHAIIMTMIGRQAN